IVCARIRDPRPFPAVFEGIRVARFLTCAATVIVLAARSTLHKRRPLNCLTWREIYSYPGVRRRPESASPRDYEKRWLPNGFSANVKKRMKRTQKNIPKPVIDS